MSTYRRMLAAASILVAAATGSPADQSKTLVFAGTPYTLAQTLQSPTQQTFTYLRSPETIDHSTQRLVVHLLPYDQDSVDYAQAVKDSMQLYAPDAKIWNGRTSSGMGTIDFTVGDEARSLTPVEHHKARAEKIPGGLRVVEFIYQKAGTGDPDWTKALAQLRLSKPSIDPAISARWQDAVRNIRWYIHSPHVFVEKKLVDVPFTLAHLPQPPPHAWLYVRPESMQNAAGLPVFLDAVRAYRATGLDLKKQPAVTDSTLAQIFAPNPGWPFEPGWQKLIDGLRYLNLKGTPVTDGGATTLAQMKPLQVLILNDLITDDGLTTIATALTNLVKFRPGGPLITDRGLKSLEGLTKLHRLDLSNTSATGRGLRALRKLSLIEVDLGAQMGDDALKDLSAIPTLVHLEMTKSRVSAAGIPELKKFTHLHTLFIGAAMDDKGIQTLIQIPTLRRLDLTGSRLTDAGLKALASLQDLEELAVGQTAVTDQGIRALASMKKLRFLEVSDTQVTSAGLAQLNALPALDVISFSNTGPLKLRDLKPLGALPNLRTIIINGAPLEHAALEYLKQPHPPAHAWNWISSAWADAPTIPLSDDTDVTQVTEAPSENAQNSTGLHRIHNVEADLDDIIPDVSNPSTEDQETAQNFLGEFSVNAAPAKK